MAVGVKGGRREASVRSGCFLIVRGGAAGPLHSARSDGLLPRLAGATAVPLLTALNVGYVVCDS